MGSVQFNDVILRGLLGPSPPSHPFGMNVSMTNRTPPRGRDTLLPHDGDIATALAAKSDGEGGFEGTERSVLTVESLALDKKLNFCFTAFSHSHALWKGFISGGGKKKNESST